MDKNNEITSVTKNVTQLTGKHLCQSLCFNKVVGEACRGLLLQTTSQRLLLNVVLDIRFTSMALF